MERRTFIKNSGLAAAGLMATSAVPSFASNLFKENNMEQFENTGLGKRFRPKHKSGFGGVALGNGFNVNPDIECLQ